ncbi:MAG: PTS transporter subunit EIIC [Clostridiales bacterium]|jgi:PTS system cellobiose-specific IIC component|nr:PTS transporter subunit EIIC [Clostridiales bacterium]
MSNTTDKLIEVAGRFGSQRHMVAIRDAFATILPLMMAGSVAVMINAIPGIINGMFGTELALPTLITDINGAVWSGTLGLVTLYTVIVISYFLAKSYDINIIGAVAAAVSAFVAVAATDAAGWTAFANFNGLLLGMILAVLSTELFRKLADNKAFIIKMPDGVPPAVARSFAALVPAVLTIFVFAAIAVIIKMFTQMAGIYEPETEVGRSVFSLVNFLIQAPMAVLANNVFTGIIIVLLAHVMWIVGLHGPNILEGPIQTLFMPNMIANMDHFAQTGNASTAPYIMTKPFLDTFVYLGGSGVTLALLIAVFMISRSKAMRTTANLSIGPGVFNINEPVLFGMPIVFNPILGIPFIITPVVLTIVSYLALFSGIVDKTVVQTFWATPPVISGFLATGGDFKAVILQIINIAIAVVIYLPFVKMADNAELKKEKEEAN